MTKVDYKNYRYQSLDNIGILSWTIIGIIWKYRLTNNEGKDYKNSYKCRFFKNYRTNQPFILNYTMFS